MKKLKENKFKDSDIEKQFKKFDKFAFRLFVFYSFLGSIWFGYFVYTVLFNK